MTADLDDDTAPRRRTWMANGEPVVDIDAGDAVDVVAAGDAVDVVEPGDAGDAGDVVEPGDAGDAGDVSDVPDTIEPGDAVDEWSGVVDGSTVIARRESRRRRERADAARPAPGGDDAEVTQVARRRSPAATVADDVPAPTGRIARTPDAFPAPAPVRESAAVFVPRTAPGPRVPQAPVDTAAVDAQHRRRRRRAAATVVVVASVVVVVVAIALVFLSITG